MKICDNCGNHWDDYVSGRVYCPTCYECKEVAHLPLPSDFKRVSETIHHFFKINDWPRPQVEIDAEKGFEHAQAALAVYKALDILEEKLK